MRENARMGCIRGQFALENRGAGRNAVCCGAGSARYGRDCQGASRVFETPCFPVGAGPSYINFAIEVETALTPEAFLALLHQVEARHGRVRKTRWAGRSIDLDLMAMEGEVRPNAKTVQAWMDLPMSAQTTQAPDTLILPHPRIQDRAFMLIPFADLAPDWTHPLIGKTVQEMCDALPDADKSEIKAQSGLEIPVN